MRIMDGQLVAFIGDSITEHLVAVNDWMETQTDGLPPVGAQVMVDRHEHRGWTAILAHRIHLAYPERRIRYINAGIGGNSSRQMLARFDADILTHQPQWLLLGAGVVEVRRIYQPDRAREVVLLDEYVANLKLMISRAQNIGAQVVLLEPTPHARPVTGGPPEVTLQDVNTLTRQYAAAMKEVARETEVGFVPLFDPMLRIEDQEFVVLLGPSGCGKTTLLRAIAGLGMADQGRISIGGRDVTYLPPRDRKISMVFQSYAIFPHMTVYDNIAFGLKMNKFDKKEIEKRVRDAAGLLHIEEMLDRYPSKMSGGQRQRVAVARAIAMRSEVLLMDEPLSNLDALLRLEMRAELKRLLQEIKTTTIYVTHDQIEALSMGDRIAVMKNGQIQQYDKPDTVYDLPANRFVGGFIGTPPMNFMQGQVQRQNGDVTVQVGDFHLSPAKNMQPLLKSYEGEPILMGIRAENMETLAKPARDALKVEVLVVEPLGSQNLLTVQIGNDLVKVSTHPTFRVAPGNDVWLRFPADKIRWVDRKNGTVLYPSKQ